MKRVSKWFSPNRPGVERCPVVVKSRVGSFQCEMTSEYPHEHPVR